MACPATGSKGRPLLQPAPVTAQTSIGSRPWFCLFTTKTLCPDTVTSSVCSPKTTGEGREQGLVGAVATTEGHNKTGWDGTKRPLPVLTAPHSSSRYLG